MRSIPSKIEFIDNKVNVIYSIFVEDPYGFAKDPTSSLNPCDHIVGYENVSNIQNDKEELDKLYNFYKKLVLINGRYWFMINDRVGWNTGFNFQDIETLYLLH